MARCRHLHLLMLINSGSRYWLHYRFNKRLVHIDKYRSHAWCRQSAPSIIYNTLHFNVDAQTNLKQYFRCDVSVHMNVLMNARHIQQIFRGKFKLFCKSSPAILWERIVPSSYNLRQHNLSMHQKMLKLTHVLFSQYFILSLVL